MPPAASLPAILFGAFDRHNFGDLLFPHVSAALLPAVVPRFAGLAGRDLRAYGGHRVEALSRLAADWGDRPVDIVHVGGELLICSAWEAAAMLLPAAEAQAAIAYLEAHPEARRRWVCDTLGLTAAAPYTVSRKLFPHARQVVYCGVGGVALDAAAPALRAEVIANLRAADAVGVRDGKTQACLAGAGITARLMPDPVALVADLFGDRIYGRMPAIAGMLQAFPHGYLAVQFSADFGDDATLARIAAQLDEASHDSGYGIVFFRAGAAPWHDDADCYRRVAAQMQRPVRIFESLDIWDICALIAASLGYCGSSLHGRIVAMAFGLPRLNFVHPAAAGGVTKPAAYAETWEVPELPTTTAIAGIAEGIRQMLLADPALLRQTAVAQAGQCREAFAELTAGIG